MCQSIKNSINIDLFGCLSNSYRIAEGTKKIMEVGEKLLKY